MESVDKLRSDGSRIVGSLYLTVYLYLTCLTVLGGNQDDTICTLRTIDRRGRSILQDREVFNVLNVQVIDVVAFETIHQYVSLTAGTKGRDTANPELTGVLARLSRTLECHDARYVTSQGVGQVRSAIVLQVIHFYIRHGTRHSELLLCAHTSNHHLVNGVLFIFFQYDIDSSFVAFDKNFLRNVTNVGKHQRAVFLHFDAVLAHDVSNGSKAFGILHNDTGTDNVFAFGIGHMTGNR